MEIMWIAVPGVLKPTFISLLGRFVAFPLHILTPHFFHQFVYPSALLLLPLKVSIFDDFRCHWEGLVQCKKMLFCFVLFFALLSRGTALIVGRVLLGAIATSSFSIEGES